MTTEQAHLHIEQEDDAPDVRRVAAICLAAIVIFALGILWVLHILATSPPTSDSERTLPRELGRQKIGMVLQTPFEQAKSIEQARNAAKQRLMAYGWVDRDKRLIHIPITRAMQLVALESRP